MSILARLKQFITRRPAAGDPGQGKVKVKRTFRQTVWEYFKAIAWALGIALLIKQFLFQAFRIPTGSMLNTLLIGDFLFVNKFLYGAKTPERLRIFNWTVAEGLPVLKLPGFRDPSQGDIIVFEYPLDRNVDYIKRCVAVAGDRVEVRDGVLHVNGDIYESNFGDRDGDHSCVPEYTDPEGCPPPRTVHNPERGQGREQNQNYDLSLALRQLSRNTETFLATAEMALEAGVGLRPEAVRSHVEALRDHQRQGNLAPTGVLEHQRAIIAHADSTGAPMVVPAGHIFMMGDNRNNSQDSRYWGPLPVKLVKGKAEILYFSWDKHRLRPRFSRMFDIIR